jgi:holo-[acyl-carrier protein] synthase
VIAGVGIDACDVARVRRALAGSAGERFRERVFTSDERAYCEGRGRARVESYAARFAAKEAAMKVLGTGWGKGVGWHDVEVLRADDGAPTIALHGEAARIAGARGLGHWHLTLTHTRALAIAYVVAERADPRDG